MMDYMLFGLISGLLVFCILFLISFISLSLIAGLVRVLAFILSELGISRHAAPHGQTA